MIGVRLLTDYTHITAYEPPSVDAESKYANTDFDAKAEARWRFIR